MTAFQTCSFTSNVKDTLIHSDSLDLRSFLLREQFEFSERHSGNRPWPQQGASPLIQQEYTTVAYDTVDGWHQTRQLQVVLNCPT